MEDLGPFVIPNSHSHDFVAKSNGQSYRAWVATPSKRQPGVSTPVLYTLDANGSFGMVVESARFLAFAGEIPPVIVVGIGYPTTSIMEAMSLRQYELTPTEDKAYLQRALAEGQRLSPNGTGGAAGYLQFIDEELAPFIEDAYGGDPKDRALFGYSLGGLFAAWAMLQPRSAFQRYIIGSPSLWWDERMLFAVEEARAAGPGELDARVYISSGELEELPAGVKTSAFRMVSNAIEFAGSLGRRGYEGLTLEMETIRNAGHEQAPMLIQGLKSIYRGFEPARRD